MAGNEFDDDNDLIFASASYPIPSKDTHTCPDGNRYCQCQFSHEVCEIVMRDKTCSCSFDRIQEERRKPIRFLEDYSSMIHSRAALLREARDRTVSYLDKETSVSFIDFHHRIDYKDALAAKLPFPNGISFIIPTILLNLANSRMFTIVMSIHQGVTSPVAMREIISIGVTLFIVGDSDTGLLYTPSIAVSSVETADRMSYNDEGTVSFVTENLVVMLQQIESTLAQFQSAHPRITQKASQLVLVTSGAATRFMAHMLTALNSSVEPGEAQFEIESRSGSSKYPIISKYVDAPNYNFSELANALGYKGGDRKMLNIRHISTNVYSPSYATEVTIVSDSVAEYSFEANRMH